MGGQFLQEYRTRRDFGKTSEPSGRRHTAVTGRRRFVIQKHAARRLHYDLRLEIDGVFRSWAVPKGPSLDPADKRLAVEVEDHPLEYGDFEGTIPAGEYGGGTVQLWDRGYWAPVDAADPKQSLASGQLKFELAGERLEGSWTLVRMNGRTEKKQHKPRSRVNWLLIRHAATDIHAGDTRPGDTRALLETDRSVASGRTMAAIAAGRGRSPTPFMTQAGRRAGKPQAGNRGAGRREQSRGRSSARATGGRRTDKSLPRFIEPQLCKLLASPPTGDGWGHEIKFDGYRIQLRHDGDEVTLRTRKGLDWTARFPEIADAARALPALIADGEIVALDAGGMPSFHELQSALAVGGVTDMLRYFLFDLLHDGREDLRQQPLMERKRQLRDAIAAAGGAVDDHIRYVEHFEMAGDAVLRSACRMSLEGIISKRLRDPYRSGRGTSWVKSKCRAGQEVVIGGWSHDAGRLRSLLVGIQRDEGLVYVGKVGTGFAATTAARLVTRLKDIESTGSPFAGEVPRGVRENVRWVEPRLVAEIEFAGWTASGKIRQAAFKGVREDKPAGEVTDEPATDEPATDVPAARSPRKRAGGSAVARGEGAVDVLGIRLSNPDKVLWPATGDAPAPTPALTSGLTKRDLAEYLELVSPEMMPHVAGRPCSIVRAPDGIDGQRFFQRHAMPGTSSVVTLTRVSGDRKPYLQVDRPEALVALAQVAALEFHPWNCVPGKPDRPGRLVFDLDPGPGVSFEAVVAAAREVRARLEAIGLPAWCKTTGGKGLHVVVPLAPERRPPDWDFAKQFAGDLCRAMAADSPHDYVVQMARRKREGRIFLDYLRNSRTATAVAPFSPRARPGAPVSMPVRWSQVRAGLDPSRYTVSSVPAALRRPSPWAGYDGSARPLRPAAARLATTGRGSPAHVRAERRADKRADAR